MPPPTLPPTPASSTDITAKDGSRLVGLQMAFELPPPAVAEPSLPPSPDARRPSRNPPSLRSPETPYPTQASETVKSRRRSSAHPFKAETAQFSLPPPPTRSRKIIQVKPHTESPGSTAPSGSKSGGSTTRSAAAATATATATATANSTATPPPSKKKPSTSAAGRKIARKTAHSLIERRRRSKMNDEFAVLKGMIPACTGEMHKLAILQASIEYLRYLEDCVAKLKARQEAGLSDRLDLRPPPEYHAEPPSLPPTRPGSPDVDMAEARSPADSDSHPRLPSVSPALLAQEQQQQQHQHQQYQHPHQPRQSSPSAASTHRYSSSISGNTSPTYPYPAASHSAFTSPALAPRGDMDQEATAALLMLNQSDRRGSTLSQTRGMSVRDLLTNS